MPEFIYNKQVDSNHQRKPHEVKDSLQVATTHIEQHHHTKHGLSDGCPNAVNEAIIEFIAHLHRVEKGIRE